MASFFEQYDLITQSTWFDPKYYLAQIPDLAALKIDPVMHYLESGASDNRTPHPNFDVIYYREQCEARGINIENPLLHFLQEGQALGLRTQKTQRETPESQTESAILTYVLSSGIFDREFYTAAYGVQFKSDIDALKHFSNEGFTSGKRPNLYFDPVWYKAKYQDIPTTGLAALLHYLQVGDAEGLQPSLIFNTNWYRSKYEIPTDSNALIHYLQNSKGCRFSPNPDFDAEYYGVVNKDVRDAGVDAFQHFLFTGYIEGRNPSNNFNIKFYVKRYLGGKLTSNPLLHYMEHKHEPGVYGIPPVDEASIPRAIKEYSKPCAEFEEFKPVHAALPKKAKVLAYYLPQFHAFPENDAWWGTGFTEWTNIARGVSRYKGHYQPRIPRDLGFYSLADALPTLKRQIALAKGGGVHGFVFYHYWFNGKRLMDGPIEQFLNDSSADMPFCLMWANENWTRRWDGDEHEVLISQDYAPDDDQHLVADFARHFKDTRYIRVHGRPLLMIYRPGIIPDAKNSMIRWRKIFRENFSEDPIFIMAQAFNDVDPTTFGFDGAIEFPPHKLTANMSSINDDLEYLDVEFTGNVFSYEDVVARSINEPTPQYPLIKTAIPSWDNDARRQGSGLVIQGSTPAKYEAWMKQLIEKARENPFFGETFVCVNAWNEWCEAAYLEPDLHYGSAYLNATSRAVFGVSQSADNCKLLLIGHDAFPSGAPQLLLNIARRLKSEHGVQIEFLLLGHGLLESAYAEIAPLTIASDSKTLLAYLDSAKKRGFANAIVNTVASAHILPALSNQGIEAITLAHELPRIVREKHLRKGVQAAFQHSRYIVFPSPVVRDKLAEELDLKPDDRTRIIPQGMYKQLEYSAHEVQSVRAKFKISKREKLIIGIGYADIRKGFDLFLQLWRQLNQDPKSRVHFCWVGDIDPTLKEWLSTEIVDACKSGSFHMTGYQSCIDAYIFAADALALTSREDPFPTVVHEALSAGRPVFAFAEAGGMSEFLIEHDMGTVVPYGNTIVMAKEIANALQKPQTKDAIDRRREFVRTKLDFSDYVKKLLNLSLPQLASVSVAIPNFNYAKFMPERIGTVFQQNHPVHEVLILDDASTDDSLTVIHQIASIWNRKITLLANERNSGSVFAQWRKAAETATGDFVWIAEADDLCDPTFLSKVVKAMQDDPHICMGFTDSRSINYDGSPLWDSYKGYYTQQEPNALSEDEVFSGDEFIRRYLSVRNLILNVSAVVWRREALLRALTACQIELKNFRMAGDWRVYLETLSQPGARIAYIAAPLNVHRRHAESITHALEAERHLAEIEACHKYLTSRKNIAKAIILGQENYRSEVYQQLKNGRVEESKTSARKSSAAAKRKIS